MVGIKIFIIPWFVLCVANFLYVNANLDGLCEQQAKSAFSLIMFGHSHDKDHCHRLCCGKRNCHVSIFSKKKCFGVHCKHPKLCATITKQLGDFEGHRVDRRSTVSHAIPTGNTTSSLPSQHNKRSLEEDDNDASEDDEENPTCPADFKKSFIPSRKKGFKFIKLPHKSNLLACSDQCCGTDECVLAFTIKNSCYGVMCSLGENCHSIRDKLPHSSIVVALKLKESLHKKNKHRKHQKHKNVEQSHEYETKEDGGNDHDHDDHDDADEEEEEEEKRNEQRLKKPKKHDFFPNYQLLHHINSGISQLDDEKMGKVKEAVPLHPTNVMSYNPPVGTHLRKHHKHKHEFNSNDLDEESMVHFPDQATKRTKVYLDTEGEGTSREEQEKLSPEAIGFDKPMVTSTPYQPTTTTTSRASSSSTTIPSTTTSTSTVAPTTTTTSTTTTTVTSSSTTTASSAARTTNQHSPNASTTAHSSSKTTKKPTEDVLLKRIESLEQKLESKVGQSKGKKSHHKKKKKLKKKGKKKNKKEEIKKKKKKKTKKRKIAKKVEEFESSGSGSGYIETETQFNKTKTNTFESSGSGSAENIDDTESGEGMYEKIKKVPQTPVKVIKTSKSHKRLQKNEKRNKITKLNNVNSSRDSKSKMKKIGRTQKNQTISDKEDDNFPEKHLQSSTPLGKKNFTSIATNYLEHSKLSNKDRNEENLLEEFKKFKKLFESNSALPDTAGNASSEMVSISNTIKKGKQNVVLQNKNSTMSNNNLKRTKSKYTEMKSKNKHTVRVNASVKNKNITAPQHVNRTAHKERVVPIVQQGSNKKGHIVKNISRYIEPTRNQMRIVNDTKRLNNNKLKTNVSELKSHVLNTTVLTKKHPEKLNHSVNHKPTNVPNHKVQNHPSTNANKTTSKLSSTISSHDLHHKATFNMLNVNKHVNKTNKMQNKINNNNKKNINNSNSNTNNNINNNNNNINKNKVDNKKKIPTLNIAIGDEDTNIAAKEHKIAAVHKPTATGISNFNKKASNQQINNGVVNKKPIGIATGKNRLNKITPTPNGRKKKVLSQMTTTLAPPTQKKTTKAIRNTQVMQKPNVNIAKPTANVQKPSVKSVVILKVPPKIPQNKTALENLKRKPVVKVNKPLNDLNNGAKPNIENLSPIKIHQPKKDTIIRIPQTANKNGVLKINEKPQASMLIKKEPHDLSKHLNALAGSSLLSHGNHTIDHKFPVKTTNTLSPIINPGARMNHIAQQNIHPELVAHQLNINTPGSPANIKNIKNINDKTNIRKVDVAAVAQKKNHAQFENQLLNEKKNKHEINTGGILPNRLPMVAHNIERLTSVPEGVQNVNVHKSNIGDASLKKQPVFHQQQAINKPNNDLHELKNNIGERVGEDKNNLPTTPQRIKQTTNKLLDDLDNSMKKIAPIEKTKNFMDTKKLQKQTTMNPLINRTNTSQRHNLQKVAINVKPNKIMPKETEPIHGLKPTKLHKKVFDDFFHEKDNNTAGSSNTIEQFRQKSTTPILKREQDDLKKFFDNVDINDEPVANKTLKTIVPHGVHKHEKEEKEKQSALELPKDCAVTADVHNKIFKYSKIDTLSKISKVDFNECAKECCHNKNCAVAALEDGVCHLVQCQNKSICETLVASKKNTRLMFFKSRYGRSNVTQELYCKKQLATGIPWQKTLAGTVALRDCPRAALGKAKRLCNQQGDWEQPDFSGCISHDYSRIFDKVKQLGRSINVRSLLQELDDVTTQTIDNSLIFGGDLIKAVQAIYSISKYVNETTSEKLNHDDMRSITRSVSNLLDETNKDEWNNLKATSKANPIDPTKLMISLDTIGLRAAGQLPKPMNMKPVITRSILLAVSKIKPELNGRNYTFPTNMVPLMNEWTARKDSITLPRNVFKPGEVTLVASMSFKTLGHFLPHRWNRKRHVIFTDGYVVNSNVISCAVQPKLSFPHNATITIVLQHLKESNPAESKCVFWDINDRENTGGSWSTEGCWVDFTNRTTTVCKCSHLTHFAVLSNINDQKISEKEQKRENVVVAAWLGIPVAVILLLGSLYVCFAWTKNPRRRHVVIMDKRPTFPDKEVVVTQTISEKYPGSPNRYLYAANCTPSPSELEWEHAWDVLTDCESHDCKDKRRRKETMNKDESTEPALNVGSKLLDTSFCVAIDDMPYTSIFTLHEVTKYFQISFEPNTTLTESRSLNDETESTCSEDTIKNSEYIENRKEVKEEEEEEGITKEKVQELRREGENIELEACETGSFVVNVYEDGCKTTLFDLVKTKDVLPNSACQDISLEHENVTEKHITFSSVQTFSGVDLNTFSRIHYCFISKIYILLKENFLVRKYVRFSRMVVLTEQNNSRRKDLQKEQTVLLTPFVKPTLKSISTLKSTLHTTSISPPSTLTVITSTTVPIPTFRNDWSLWKDIDYTQPIKNVVESTVHKYMTMEKQLHKINRASKELSFEGSNKTTSNSQTTRQKDVKATTNVGHNFRTQTAHMRSYIALRQQSRRNDIQLAYRSTTRKPKIYKSVTFKRKMGSREGSESKLKNPSIPSPQKIANRPNTKEEFLNVLKLNKPIVGTKSSQ